MHSPRSLFSTCSLWLALALATGLFASPAIVAPAARAGNPPVIISPSTATSVVNGSFNYQIVLANFATGTYSADNLAPGLTLNAQIGAISGAPSQVGTFAITLHATNADGTGSSTLTLTVVPSAPPEITSALTATALTGSDFRYQITATNNPANFSARDLPDGLSVDLTTGIISGVPTVAGAFAVTVAAENFQGITTATLNLNITRTLPVVTLTTETPTTYPLHGEVGSFTLTRTGDDLTLPVTVVFTIKGTARNGVDYQLLPFSKTIKAGKAVKRIHLNPLNTADIAPGTKLTVKLTLQPSDAYRPGDTTVAKVKVLYDP